MANAWTLGEIVSNATKIGGYRDDISLSVASFWANQAYTDFCRDFEEFLSEKTMAWSVSSGSSIWALPGDFRQAISLSETTTEGRSYPIPQIAPEYADGWGYFPVGSPQGYFIFGGNIQIWPSASSSALTTHASSARNLFLRYKWVPESMLSTASVPSVATEHRIAIMWKTLEYIHNLTGNIEESIVAEARYTQLLASFKDGAYKRQAERGGFRIRLADASGRRMEGRMEDQTNTWLSRWRWR